MRKAWKNFITGSLLKSIGLNKNGNEKIIIVVGIALSVTFCSEQREGDKMIKVAIVYTNGDKDTITTKGTVVYMEDGMLKKFTKCCSDIVANGVRKFEILEPSEINSK